MGGDGAAQHDAIVGEVGRLLAGETPFIIEWLFFSPITIIY